MNPARGDPAGGRPPRLLPPAGVEADRRHRRRAGREHRARVRASSSVLCSAQRRRRRRRPTRVDTRRRRRAPAAGVLQPGDRIVAVDGVRGDPDALREPDLDAPLRRRADGRLPGRDAGARHRRARRRASATVAITPRLRRRARSGRCSASRFGRSTRRASGPVERGRARASTRCGASPAATVDDDRRHLRAPRSARRSPASSAPTRRRARRSSFDADAGALPARASSRCRSASSTCSRSCRSTAATSSGRWPRRCAAARSRSRVMERAGFVGFALVIVLFVIGLTNDIGRLTGEGFQVR